MPQAKYITRNGVLIKNPDYVPEGGVQRTVPVATAYPVSHSDAPLAMVSSVSDVMDASAIQQQATGLPVPMSLGTEQAVSMMQDDFILDKFKAPGQVDGGEILDKIGEIFAKYEVALGMLNKLLALSTEEVNLDFLVDDSSSMSARTDVNALEAEEPVKTAIREKLGREPLPNEKMTRIQEAENRLHIMLGILAYIPVPYMEVRFLNSKEKVVLQRQQGETPDQFKERTHRQIRDLFKGLTLIPYTPLYEPIKEGFERPGRWCHYVFNDGSPNKGGDENAVSRLIWNRHNPKDHALTLISCTDNDRDTEWMKLVDTAPYVAELDDFLAERKEVTTKQGAGFELTKGLWILAHLLAARNPHDLDAMDENVPFTRFILENILGRKLNPDEYQYYFERNPNAELYVNEYPAFLNDDSHSGLEIVPKIERERRQRVAGYSSEGERPLGRPLAQISSALTAHTAAAKVAFQQIYGALPQESQLPPPPYSPWGVDAIPPGEMRSAASMAPAQSFMPPPAYSQGSLNHDSTMTQGLSKRT